MAEARKKVKELPDGRLQMTSMIDVVFLLIIFFMCVTEMTKMEVEASITLPEAIKAIPDKGTTERVVVNVTRDGTYRLMMKSYDKEALMNHLKRVALTNRGADGLSTVAVKIRGDADVSYKYVQYVLMCCMEAKIWQVSFGVAQKNVQGVQ
jgi:biopolymer transport protein ExbD